MDTIISCLAVNRTYPKAAEKGIELIALQQSLEHCALMQDNVGLGEAITMF